MTISARNIFKGKVTAIKKGPINAEVEITAAGGDVIVAMLTETSVRSLGLAIGNRHGRIVGFGLHCQVGLKIAQR